MKKKKMHIRFLLVGSGRVRRTARFQSTRPYTLPIRPCWASSLTHELREIFVNFFLRLHRGPEQPRIQTEVLGHSLVCLLVHSHHSHIRLLRPTHFARVLRCARLLAHSLARGKLNDRMSIYSVFFYSGL